jgi:hypothetical protein
VTADFTHAEKPRIAAAFLDFSLAGLLAIQTESILGIDTKDSTESIVGLCVGLLFLSCKDCVGGISPGKGLFGCILIDESTLRPVDASTAFKRNARVYGSVAGILVACYVLGSAAGEMIGSVAGCFALIGLFPYFASKIDSWEGTAVALRKSLRPSHFHRPPETTEKPPESPRNSKSTPSSPPPPSAPSQARSGVDLPEMNEIRLSISEMLELLNLSAPFTTHELRTAYRKAIGEYHPDRAAHLAKEIQTIAEQRSKQINHAYEHLKPRVSDAKQSKYNEQTE